MGKKDIEKKELNLDVIASESRKNPTGNPILAEILREQAMAELVTNPREYRIEGSYISR